MMAASGRDGAHFSWMARGSRDPATPRGGGTEDWRKMVEDSNPGSNKQLQQKYVPLNGQLWKLKTFALSIHRPGATRQCCS